MTNSRCLPHAKVGGRAYCAAQGFERGFGGSRHCLCRRAMTTRSALLTKVGRRGGARVSGGPCRRWLSEKGVGVRHRTSQQKSA